MSGPDPAKATATSAANTNLSLSGLSADESKTLFGAGLPMLKTAGDYYTSLASGDPDKIFKAIAPAAEGISSQTEQAKKTIQNLLPQGGEKNLALEQAELQKSGQIGNLETQAYTGAFPALAQIAASALGLSTNSVSNAISAAAGAGQTSTDIMQANAAGKGATMGMLGSLASAGGGLGAGAMGMKGSEAIAGALA